MLHRSIINNRKQACVGGEEYLDSQKTHFICFPLQVLSLIKTMDRNLIEPIPIKDTATSNLKVFHVKLTLVPHSKSFTTWACNAR